MKEPFFSIITPAYNADKFIQKTLDSVKLQTFKDFEWIIVDDGSPDETASVIAAWIEENPDFPLVFIRQENRKVAAARNRAIDEAKGQFLAFLDADDEWSENKLLKTYEKIQETGLDGIFCHDAFAKTWDGRIHYHRCGPGVTFEDFLFEGNCLVTSGTVVSRREVCALDGFITDLKFNGVEDYDLWMRLIEKGSTVTYIHEALSVYNVVPGSLSQQLENQSQREFELLQMHFDRYDPKTLWVRYRMRNAFSRINLGVARRMQLKGECQHARRYYARVIKWNPFLCKAWILAFLNLLGFKASRLSYLLTDLMSVFQKRGADHSDFR